MRIALISDIHGNLLALRAVLADLQSAPPDRIVCLGDTATLGPDPLGVLHTLQELGCDCIMGNHDSFLLRPDLVARYTRAAPVVEAIEWCQRQCGERELAFVRGFRGQLKLQLDAQHALLLFHGAVRSNTQDLLATTPADELDALLGDAQASVMAGGHTHIQMLRQHRGCLLVNPGSVGAPFREFVAGARPQILSHAEYAVVSAHAGQLSVELRRVPLARQALRHAVAQWPNAPALLQADLLRQYA